jgi:hypothetical protein
MALCLIKAQELHFFYDLGKTEAITYQDLEGKESSFRAVDPGVTAKTVGLQ